MSADQTASSYTALPKVRNTIIEYLGEALFVLFNNLFSNNLGFLE